MKKALIAISIGDEIKNISKLTHPTLQSYAKKINADFIVIDSCKTTPHWEKFQIFDLLNSYDRIIYLDTDLIVRDDCPDLFDIVPYNKIGAFNEAKFVPREYSLIEACKSYDINPEKINWNGKYYNTGVLVISKCHKFFFKKPEKEISNFYEQGYLNLKFAIEEGKRKEENSLMYDLPYKLNRMTCLDFCGETRHSSFIIHYAGYHYFTVNNEILSIIKGDLEKWENDKPEYNYKRNIVIVVSGGMGDQVDAEPTLRFLEKVYKDNTTEIIITTHWPRLFKHLKYKIIHHDDFNPSIFQPFFQIKTFPDPKTVVYSIISNLLCHTVDYCSIASLQRVLPLQEKIIKIQTTKEDDDELDEILKGFDLRKAVIVHPGRHWESKTFPIEWWQKVVDGISKEIPVCLIGTDDHENRGAYQLELPSNSISLIDRTSVGVLISAISRAPVLLSNDSVPIHLAGAFDNWIIIMPTCKHPDHVLPFRKTSEGYITPYHKADALYKKLTLDDCDQRPTTWIEGGATAELIKQNWDFYLPTEEEVIEKVLERFKQ
ncbi:MAG: glycosyltransferase [Candidatus Nanoarchaeia archaeon]|jgi:hypothetical protein|nr:glycosyltransferase [Candidatus Nanoarchaeia archaeon]